MRKTAIITGASGQDGAYLSQMLLEKGYQVHAAVRRSSSQNHWRLEYLDICDNDRFKIVEYDCDDLSSSIRLIEKINPDEIYNLAAQTFVASSFDLPVGTCKINGIGSLHLLEAIRTVNRNIRYYQASSAEMFGKVQAIPQSETTPFYPRSPYGVSKLFAHWMTVNYRESHGLFACSGILFNHESPLRGREFVTRRISEAVAQIAHGRQSAVSLGNLNAQRDWGYAKEYVEGMWRMLQADAPDDYVLATGRTETVRQFATLAFKAAGMEIEWHGKAEHERAFSVADGRLLVQVDPSLYRPAEVDLLVGDAGKALRLLNWRSQTSLEDLCAMMVRADLQRVAEKARAQPVRDATDLSPARATKLRVIPAAKMAATVFDLNSSTA